jgi:hypothetical protein
VSAEPTGSLALAAGTALWLGLVTSISPCPLATNVAAIGFLARFSASAGLQLAAGLLYALGRALAYAAVGGAITWGLMSTPELSDLLQRHVGRAIGPLLVLAGMVLLGLLPGMPSFGATGVGFQRRLASFGFAGSGLMGFAFALAFCPVSAALFFGSLLPLAFEQESIWLLPGLFGVGSAAPVVALGLGIALGRDAAARSIAGARAIDRWLVPATGWALVAIGVYSCVTRTVGL